MSGFPASYHKQLEQQNLLGPPPSKLGNADPTTSNIDQKLSFSGLFQPNSSSKFSHKATVKDAKAISPPLFAESISSSTSELQNQPVALNPNLNSDIDRLKVDASVQDTTPAIEPVPEPKKRGRRKGSKGIDSTLAEASKMLGADLGSHLPQQYNSRSSKQQMLALKQQNQPQIGNGNSNSASFSSYNDIKQKIASASGSKKVKTTKELLADLQNRKQNNSSEGFISSVVPHSIVSPSSSSGEIFFPF